ncbi:MAG TPA: fatty acid desaturase [Pseudonocardiaceae bacterium]
MTYSVAQFAVVPWLATGWNTSSTPVRGAAFTLLVLLTTYNVVVVTHVFTHVPWFRNPALNALASMVNSVNIGQSVQAYQLTHVRNHHRHNNDRPGPGGVTRDTSSTYRRGRGGEHAGLLRYALGGALSSLAGRGAEILAGYRLWRVGPREHQLLSLATRTPHRRRRELNQIRLDRAAHCGSLGVFAAISWQWTLLCYLPAWFLALALVNVQNYYRHYGARPGDRAADAVSHYGRLYNLLTFNDGYHQEHHLRPNAHWSELPAVRERHRCVLDGTTRVVSPVPAMLGFLHRDRPMLHRAAIPGAPPGGEL